MTEKIGLIKNPLTIIAIFAGIAEVSGTIVLPFIAAQNQATFIHFLIYFPSILVLLFFITLNFNNKVLYAPSDYKDETHYIKINKYDFSKQRTIEVSVPKEDSSGQHILEMKERVESLNGQMIKLEALLLKSAVGDSGAEEYIETYGYKYLVSNFDNVSEFISHMKIFSVQFEVYHSPGAENQLSSFQAHRAIWLGKEVNLRLAQLVIKEAKSFYPHLKYIQLSGNIIEKHQQIYIGGSTQSAIKMFKRLPMGDADFNKLQEFRDIDSFHEFINRFGE
jgi:hypothetical protein